MRMIGVVLWAMLALSLVSADAASELTKDTIRVTGKSTVKRRPDICYVTLYVKGEGILLVDAVKKVHSKVAEIEKTIREKHKKVKAVEVTEVKVGEKQRRYWSSDQKDEAPRPQAIKRIRITLPPVPSLAHEVVDTAIRSGAIMKIDSDVRYPGRIDSVVVYGLIDASELKGEARKKATEVARKNAKETAALVEKKIGEVVSIDCSMLWPQGGIFPMERQDFPVEHVGANSEHIEISHSIIITFELLDQ